MFYTKTNFNLNIAKCFLSIFIILLFPFQTYAGIPIPSFTKSTISSSDNGRTAIGDIDGDGKNDIVVHKWGTNRSKIADGAINWYRYPDWKATNIKTNGNVFGDEIKIHDLDKDGDMDVIACQGNDNTAGDYWWENVNRDGSIWKEHHIGTDTGHSEVKSMDVDDLDGDGKYDVISRRKTLLVIWYQNNKTNWTKKEININGRENMGIGDIDMDGDIDIVLNGYWLQNPGNRTSKWNQYDFDSFWYKENTKHWADNSVKVEVADINEDGINDIVLSNSEKPGYTVRWYSSTNPTKGDTAWIKHEIEIVDYCHTLQVEDMNNDGHLDIIAGTNNFGLANKAGKKIVVFLNDGSGLNWKKVNISTNDYCYSGKVGDVGSDGMMDFVSSWTWQDSPIQLWTNSIVNVSPRIDLSLSNWKRYLIDESLEYNAVFVLSGDLNGDNNRDIIAGGWWYSNLGKLNGNWTKNIIGSNFNNVIAVYDFDNDGDLDLLGQYGANALNSLGRLCWAENDGKGIFTIRTNIQEGTGDFLQGVQVGLFNGNIIEIALSWHKDGYGVQMLTVPSNPSAEQWTRRIISSIDLQEDLSKGDIDRDGDLDLLLGTYWLENKGVDWITHQIGTVADLTFASNPEPQPDRNNLVDMDNDGDLDAIIGLENGKEIVWFENPQDSGLVSEQWPRHIINTVIGQGFSMDAKDIDNDGDVDVLVGEHRGPDNNRVIIFENTGKQNNWKYHLIDKDLNNIIDHHDGTQLVDMDMDGDLDIISVGWYNKKVWLFENNAHPAFDIAIKPKRRFTFFTEIVYFSFLLILIFTLVILLRSLLSKKK